MMLTYRNGLFAVRTATRDEGQRAKAAGARWHGPHDSRWPADRCAACKVGLPLMDWWYWPPWQDARAAELVEYADELAKAELARREGAAAAPLPPAPPRRGMYMTVIGGLFAVRTHNREEGAAAKAAGAQWHGPHSAQWPADRCPACKAGVPLMDWWYFAPANAARAVRLAEIADDAAREALAMSVARRDVSSSAGEAPVADATARALIAAELPAPPGLAYRPYQRAGIAFMRAAAGGALLADEPGLGKTIQVIGLINAENIERSLIVVPASLRLNWVREAVRWLTRPTTIFVVGEKKIVDGMPAGRHTLLAGPELPVDVCRGPLIVIANYDRVRDERVWEGLMACRWDLLAADEAHALKNPRAQRTQALLGQESRGKLTEEGLRHRASRFVAMTGTPLPNRPVEMWPILHAVAPATFPDFFRYARRYCDAKKTFISRRVGEKWDFSGASNLGELQEIMRSTCMVRRLKADVITELPPKQRQIVQLPIDDFEDLITGEEADRGAIAEAIMAELEIERARDATSPRVYELEALLLGTAGKIDFESAAKMRQQLALRKVPHVLEICDLRLEEEPKILIFAHHHAVIEKIMKHYNKKGKPDQAVALYGPMSAQERDAAVQRFQSDPEIKVFVGSIMAAGVGLTLTAASTVVFAEVDWVPGNIVQAEDRAHRIGQTQTVNVIHIAVAGTLDATMVQYLVSKADIADQALDRRPTAIVIPDAEERERRVQAAKRELAAKFPPTSPRLVELVQTAMRELTILDEDRAQKQNERGFSKIDGDIGRRLAFADDPSPALVWNVGVKLGQKYRRQLGALSTEISEEAERLREVARQASRTAARQEGKDGA